MEWDMFNFGMEDSRISESTCGNQKYGILKIKIINTLLSQYSRFPGMGWKNQKRQTTSALSKHQIERVYLPA